MTTPHDPVVIVSAARTPMGSFQGDFASLSHQKVLSSALSWSPKFCLAIV
jgi:acetyl-CoA C-acetyltransferase